MNEHLQYEYLWEFPEKMQDVILSTYLPTWTNESLDFSKCVVEKHDGGAHSLVYRVTYFDFGEHSYCIKIPQLGGINTKIDAANALQKFAHELEKSTQVYASPFTHRYTDVLVCVGWPLFKSSWRTGTLKFLISNKKNWTPFDQVLAILQTVWALRFAVRRGISPHQDLKPENIFYEDNTEKFAGFNGIGIRFHCRLADFALANGYRELGHPFGSRPYQAPEQYKPIRSTYEQPEKIDVFALGVILYEVLEGGRHPIGEITGDVWPESEANPKSKKNKWKRENTWRKWAEKEVKDLSFVTSENTKDLKSLILKMLSNDPADRPCLESIEIHLKSYLTQKWPEQANSAFLQADFWESESENHENFENPLADLPHLKKHIAGMREAALKILSN